MKKTLLLLSSIALITCFITGCATNQTTDDSSNSNSEAEESVDNTIDTTENSSDIQSDSENADKILSAAYKITEFDGNTITVVTCTVSTTDPDQLDPSCFTETENSAALNITDFATIILTEDEYDLSVGDYLFAYVDADGTITLRAYH